MPKLKDIQATLRSLDDSFHETRSLETEKSLRYSQLKTKNMSLWIDLDRANKRNKDMLSKTWLSANVFCCDNFGSYIFG